MKNKYSPTREQILTSYLPKSLPVEKTERPGGIVYTWTNGSGQLMALFFHGKKATPDHYNRYQSELYRQNHIENFFKGLQAHEELKAEMKERRKNVLDGIEVGAIMVNTWGYDQTNVDFYQVVSRTSKTITIRELAQKSAPDKEDYGWAGGRTLPIKDSFTSPAKVVRSPYRLWDGKPVYYSHDH